MVEQGELFSGGAALNAHNGTYTVQHAEHGHYTVKLYTAGGNSALAGRRILALLEGPTWTGVAFWDDPTSTVKVWRRFATVNARGVDAYTWDHGWSKVEKKLALWANLICRGYTFTERGLELLPTWETCDEHEIKDGQLYVNGIRRGSSYWIQEGYSLLLEGRCALCNRPLTHPESIRIGIGPECRKR